MSRFYGSLCIMGSRTLTFPFKVDQSVILRWCVRLAPVDWEETLSRYYWTNRKFF